jgi:hypothetical protein
VAKVEVKMPEEFLLRLSRLGERTDEIIPKVLEAGGEVVLSKVKSNLLYLKFYYNITCYLPHLEKYILYCHLFRILNLSEINFIHSTCWSCRFRCGRYVSENAKTTFRSSSRNRCHKKV